MTDRDDLISWATRNRRYLLGKTSDEVAFLARLNEFPMDVICNVLSHWSPLSGLDMRMREAFGIGSELHYLESQNLLRSRWENLAKHQQGED